MLILQTHYIALITKMIRLQFNFKKAQKQPILDIKIPCFAN